MRWPLYPLEDLNEGMIELAGPALGMDWGATMESDERIE